MNTPRTSDLSPQEAIRNVLGRYAIAVDDRDFDQVGRCFTTDAVASYSGLTIPPGRSNVVDHIRGVSRTTISQHYLQVMTIDVDGDHATTMSFGYAILVQEKDGATRSLARGMRYADKFRRTEEGWQIYDRLHTCGWQWELPVQVDPGGMWEPIPLDNDSTIYRTVRDGD